MLKMLLQALGKDWVLVMVRVRQGVMMVRFRMRDYGDRDVNMGACVSEFV